MKQLSNRNLELSVIASMLYSRDTLLQGTALLTANHFSDQSLQNLFKVSAEMAQSKQVVDLITIQAELTRRNQINDNYYLLAAELMNISTSTDIRTHSIQLKDYTFAREMARVGRDFTSQIEENGLSVVAKMRETAIPLIREIVESSQPKKSKMASLRQIMPAVFEQIQKSMNGEGISGLRTGITELDLATTGFHPGEFIIIGGRPGHGKSSFGVQVGENIALTTGKPPLFFSLEMPKEQLVTRMLASRSGVSSHRIRGGLLGSHELNSLNIGCQGLIDLPFYIEDSSGLTIDEIYYGAEKAVRDENVGSIIIDYLQLVRGRSSESRTIELGTVSKTCKEMSKDFGVPVIALAQLGRGNEKALTVRRPVLSDLRESGDLEQDADAVIFTFQPDMYLKPGEKGEGIAELIIAKQRNGPLKTVKTKWQGQFTRYENMEQDDEYPSRQIEEQEEVRF